MAVLVLPQAVGERYEIVKKLRRLGCFVAGWELVPISQLRDIWQKEEELARAKKPDPVPLSVAKRKEVGAALKEYRQYLALRKDGSRKLFY